MPGPAAAVLGGGPAGLMAAERLSLAGVDVTVYDRMPTFGRKLLMAGRGGLNLTHSEPIEQFLVRYGESRDRVEPAIRLFPPAALRAWCADLGQDTFVGSSGRVFPNAMKASPLLRAWLGRLSGQGVRFAPRHRWLGWTNTGGHRFETPSGEREIAAEATVLCLGGASWPNLGSDGRWAERLSSEGCAVTPFAPSNAAVEVPWSEPFLAKAEGQPVKAVALACGSVAARGDVVVTRFGLEGGPVYALASALRTMLAKGEATIVVDLRPDMPPDAVLARIGRQRGSASLSNHLRKALHLTPTAIALLNEAAIHQGFRLAALDAAAVARLVKAVPVRVTGMGSLDRAISTAGGLGWSGLAPDLALRGRPGTFAAGEMLDWEAPTGGYLLQACFATGRLAGDAAAAWLAARAAARVDRF